jgi:signal transduction histidine kinase/streptogramin lyase
MDSPWSVRVWQSDDGLPNNQVTSLAQTADGYLWAATSNRLVRFDGVSFEEFTPKDFAPGMTQRIAALLSTPRGLWMGLDHGALLFVDGNKTRVVATGVPDRVAQTLIETADGTIWVCYRGGFVYRLTAKGAVPCTADEGFPPGYVCSLAVDRAGTTWFGKDGHVGFFRDGRFVVPLALTRRPTRIAAAAAGGLWICAGHQLYRYTAETTLTDVGTYEPSQPTAEPTALLEDHAGGLWIGTSDSGLFHFDGTRIESVPTSHRAITSLLEDREGSLWVGTDGGGVNRVRPRAVRLENATTGLPFDTIQSLTEDTQGTLWITTQNGLLGRRGATGWETLSARPDWPGGRPTAIAADPAGGVWIATKDYALHHWRDGRYQTWRPADGLLGHTVHALVVAANGDLWLGEESPDILQRLRDGQFKTFKLPTGIRIIRAMAEDSDGDLWLGTSKGVLLRLHDEAVIDETTKISGHDALRSIRYLRAGSDGKLWIAYADEGLGLHQHGRFGNIRMEHGLPDNNLSQVIPDGHGWLWVAGDHGIFKAPEADLENVAWGRASSARTVRYGQNEGLASLQANFGDSPGALRTRDDRIWLPLRTALAVVNPTETHENAVAPPVILKRVRVNDSPVAWFGGVLPVGTLFDLQRPRSELQLEPDHRRLEIEYAALSYAAPDNVRFRYRLEGFDDEWVEAGTQRSARYSRLPAGPYRFHVKASNGDGVWSETGAVLAFTVTPFFWQTWWFRAAAFAAFFLSVVGGVRYISLRRLRQRLHTLEQQTALDRERARIARDMHDDLGSRLTHMALLVELAQRAPAETRESRMSQVASTVRRASESLDEIVWTVNPGNDLFTHLVHYIGQYAMEFLGAANIRCRVDFPDPLPAHPVLPDVRHNLFLVVKEALNNIVRHAHASEVWLRATVSDATFTLCVEDNGRGFAGEPSATGADGLNNMRRRIADIGGQLEIASTPGAGTRLSIVLAWPREKLASPHVAAVAPTGRL